MWRSQKTGEVFPHHQERAAAASISSKIKPAEEADPFFPWGRRELGARGPRSALRWGRGALPQLAQPPPLPAAGGAGAARWPRSPHADPGHSAAQRAAVSPGCSLLPGFHRGSRGTEPCAQNTHRAAACAGWSTGPCTTRGHSERRAAQKLLCPLQHGSSGHLWLIQPENCRYSSSYSDHRTELYTHAS